MSFLPLRRILSISSRAWAALALLGAAAHAAAPNENHRQICPNGMHNMDLYSFGRAGREQKYAIRGMSGNDHVCIIGFAPASRTHNEMTALIEAFLKQPFKPGVKPKPGSRNPKRN